MMPTPFSTPAGSMTDEIQIATFAARIAASSRVRRRGGSPAPRISASRADQQIGADAFSVVICEVDGRVGDFTRWQTTMRLSASGRARRAGLRDSRGRNRRSASG